MADPDNRTGGRIRQIPLLPLRDIVIFPHQVAPLFVGREKSVAALQAALAGDKQILFAAQKKAKTNEPAPADIYGVGTVATIIQLLRLPDDTVKVLVEGKTRAAVRRYLSSEKYFLVEAEELSETATRDTETEAVMRTVRATFEQYVRVNRRIPPDLIMSVQTIEDPSQLADTIVVHLSSVKLTDRQAVLETFEPRVRLERVFELMQTEIDILQVQRRIRSRVKKQMEKDQREYYLNQQKQAIQKELGEQDEFKAEIAELEQKIKDKPLSDEARERVEKELRKLKLMSPMSAEATVVRNYIDWVLSIPWAERSEENRDIGRAQAILEEDHYGLKKVKERILEFLAVNTLVGKLKGPILCFVGPPGVGKTSVSKSIARATGRKFVRMSLGGVRDEAEIRGHRRTYIGALPGKIIHNMKKVGVVNPVFLLDEVDKMTVDWRGDPASALLEVLDPEQNFMFNDHYLDLDYDLSSVMFITTANTLAGIPVPLQDRLEIIEIPSYTEFEKLNIAVQYLVPRQREACGLADEKVEFSESAIRAIINHYTKEAGVRQLEREIASVCRKIAIDVVRRRNHEPGAQDILPSDPDAVIRVAAKHLPKLLGIPKYKVGKAERRSEVGLVNGLAVTATGGDLLTAEVATAPGSGKLVLTGKLGDVMQESGQAALSYVRSRAKHLGLAEDFYKNLDVHVHFPEGAVPKDGPSAGITIATALVSALTRIPVKCDVALTGEITLRGRVLAVGGLREKLLAAHRGNITTVIMPKESRKDLKDVPRRVLQSLRLVLVEHMDEVLREALVLADPESFLGDVPPSMEYRGGQLYVPDHPEAHEPPEAPEAPPAAPPAEQLPQ
ncbi:MAG: endopeptidase La [Myxococcales bacterium]|nr:endopeptidase La [Myxococcales bacterium]